MDEKYLIECKNRQGDNYPKLSEMLRSGFESAIISGSPLFLTNATNLFDVFLKNLPEEGRQHYNCNCCRHFVNRYGGLVALSQEGEMYPAVWNVLWNGIPTFFAKAVEAVREVILKSKITDIFVSDNE